MHREIRELDGSELGRPASGSVAPWVKVVVGLAAITVVAVAALGARALWRFDGHSARLDGFWFRNGLAVGLGIWVVAVFLPPGRVSRFIRLAALLPILLLGGMVVAWVLWGLVAPRMPFLWKLAPLLRDVPVGAALLVVLGSTCLAALLVMPRGPGAWIRALVVIALLELLLLGLWLPLASVGWGGGSSISAERWQVDLGSSSELIATALGPPLLLATAFAALVLHRPAAARALQGLGTAMFWLLFPLVIIARIVASADAKLVYLNLVHFLAASAFVAAAALVALVASLWLRSRSARRRLARERAPVVGVIPDDGDDRRGVVACLELEGWLSGPRPLVDSFEVATQAGRIPIPIGARLAASLPEGSSILHVGEAVAVIRRGDRVVVGGLIAPDADHPFRSSAALVPGPDGVVVRRQDDQRDDFATIALVAWRPCVAFLVILIAIAVPGLIAGLGLY